MNQSEGQKALSTSQQPVDNGAETDVPNENPSFDPNGSAVTDANNPSLGNVETNADSLKAASDAVKNYSNQKDSTEVQATPPRTFARFSSLSQPASTSSNASAQTFSAQAAPVDATAQAAPAGTNVNDQVTASNYKLSTKTVDANDSGSTDMSVDLSVADSVKSGDYFTVQFPKYLNYFGNSTPQSTKIPDLMNGDQVVASGAFNPDDNSLTYTFTDYVDTHDNVTGSFNLPLWADRNNAKDSGNYPVTTTVAGEAFNDNVQINYRTNDSQLSSNIDSFITHTDQATGDYQQVIYVNPQGKEAYNTKVNLYNYWPNQNTPGDSSAQLNPDVTSYKIYEVRNGQEMYPSYYLDENNPNLVDVTDWNNQDYNFNPTYSTDANGGEVLTLDFQNLTSNGSQYIIVLDSKSENGNRESIKTRVEMSSDVTPDGQGHNYYTWDNENIYLQGSGEAIGDDTDADADADADADGDHPGEPHHDTDGDNGHHGSGDKELPDTGNDNKQAGLFGGLFAALGSALLFGRRKKDKKE
ncbi:fibronectin-binding protein FnbA [Staphylococcus carnosus]|uniref:fibronectin-binding protein FnbA n=1 Tax=Staphylococcus carnosus TaxID=1281 RepID=UPI00081A4315|nr:Ig-like domain-containing protein [Staphylococcus carnosus]ANZ34538.1 hypothetical protein BEK99_12610 [Staphylococcus carnosus]UTB84401.1 hypothetical protein A2I66_01230 [Staphylococcus carnosus]